MPLRLKSVTFQVVDCSNVAAGDTITVGIDGDLTLVLRPDTSGVRDHLEQPGHKRLHVDREASSPELLEQLDAQMERRIRQHVDSQRYRNQLLCSEMGYYVWSDNYESWTSDQRRSTFKLTGWPTAVDPKLSQHHYPVSTKGLVQFIDS